MNYIVEFILTAIVAVFLAITFFSTIERNVNIKTLLEDIAEKVLVIPVEIQNVLKTLDKE